MGCVTRQSRCPPLASRCPVWSRIDHVACPEYTSLVTRRTLILARRDTSPIHPGTYSKRTHARELGTALAIRRLSTALRPLVTGEERPGDFFREESGAGVSRVGAQETLDGAG